MLVEVISMLGYTKSLETWRGLEIWYTRLWEFGLGVYGVAEVY